MPRLQINFRLMQTAMCADQEIPRPPNRDPDSEESRIPSPFPGKKRESGDPISDCRVASEHQPQWTRNMLSREYHASPFTGSMRLLFRVRDSLSEREHAAVSDERQLQ